MFGFLNSPFADNGSSRLVIEAYWCETAIKLFSKIQTPLGSKVSVVNVCVDIHYAVEDGRIMLQKVLMSGGGGIMGSTAPINIASGRTGEAWYATVICSENDLARAVENDLSSNDSRLRQIMMGKWLNMNTGSSAESPTGMLNALSSSDQNADSMAALRRGNKIVFTYTKANGESETRHVTIEDVTGDSIRALDHKDGKVKKFLIDRITKSRIA